MPAAHHARHFHRVFVGLAASGREENPATLPPRRKPHELLGYSCARVVEERGSGITQLCGLLGDRSHDGGMAMTVVDGDKPGREIEIALARGVVEVTAFCA